MTRAHRFLVYAQVSVFVAIIGAISQSDAQVNDGYVAVYEDSLGTQPCAAVPPWTGATLYVIGKLAGATSSGVTGVEFRIEVTSPAGWSISYSPPAADLVLGNPLDLYPADPNDGSGVNLVFANCLVPDTNGNVALGTLTVINFAGSPTDLLVKRHSNPKNPTYQCPLFTICDAPLFSKVCMSASAEPWCSLAVSKIGNYTGAENDAPISTSNIYHEISGVLHTLPDSVPESAGWALKAFVRGDSHVRGYIHASEAACLELDQLTDGITLENHDGAWGRLLVDWPGLHVLSRKRHHLFEQPEPAVFPQPAKSGEQPTTLTETLIFQQYFDDTTVPSTDWPVSFVGLTEGECYWGGTYQSGSGPVYCARWTYEDPPDYCSNYFFGYPENMDTCFSSLGLNGGNGIYIGNATNVRVRHYFRMNTELNFDTFVLLVSNDGGGWSGPGFSGAFDFLTDPLVGVINDGPRQYIDLRFDFFSNGANNLSGVEIERIEVVGDIIPQNAFNLTSRVASIEDVFGDPYKKRVTIETKNVGQGTAPPSKTGLIRFQPFLNDPTVDDCYRVWNVPELLPSEIHPHVEFIDFDPILKPLPEIASIFVNEDLQTFADVGHWWSESSESDNSGGGIVTWVIELPPIILVPGIMGSELEKVVTSQPETVWSGDLLTTGRTLVTRHDVLLLNPTESEAVGGPMTSTAVIRSLLPFGLSHVHSFVRNSNLAPYFGINLGHNNLLNFNVWTGTLSYLQTRGYTLGVNLFEFHYDWRKQLQGQTFTALGNLIQTAQSLNSESASHLMVISHSLGGLVVQGYANSKIAVGQPHGIRSWITLGTPFQGSVDAFASLLGQNQMFFEGLPIMGPKVGNSIREIARTSSAVQTLLPTPDYNRVIYEKGAPCQWQCPEPVVIEQTARIQEILAGQAQMPPDWSMGDPVVYQRASQFHNVYTDATAIQHVYHIMNNDFPTLEKITWHLETDVPILGDKSRFDLRYSIDGDGTVPEPSALSGDPGGAYYYLYNNRHLSMADRTAVATFAYLRAVNPRDETLIPDLWQLNKPTIASIVTPNLVIQFKVVDFWMETPPSTLPFPVTLEIIDLNTGQMMLGTYRILDNGTPSELAATVPQGQPCQNWSSDDQQFWAIALPDGYYRLVLLPNPDFWFPDDGGPMPGLASDPGPFEIRGQLAKRDARTYWSAPGSSEPTNLIHFYGVNGTSGTSNLGFSAYEDFHLVGGQIQESELILNIDAEGDGIIETTVTEVTDQIPPDTQASPQLAIFPNPFHTETTIRWGMFKSPPGRVEVFSANGRRIRQATLRPSDQAFIWDGKSDDGKHQPSGVYFVRVAQENGRVLASWKVMKLR